MMSISDTFVRADAPQIGDVYTYDYGEDIRVRVIVGDYDGMEYRVINGIAAEKADKAADQSRYLNGVFTVENGVNIYKIRLEASIETVSNTFCYKHTWRRNGSVSKSHALDFVEAIYKSGGLFEDSELTA